LRRRFGLVSRVGAALLLGVMSVLVGCANAPEIPLLPKLVVPTPPPAVTQTVYVPVYVEVEKAAPVVVPPPEPFKLPDDQEQSLALLIEMARSSNASPDELRKDFLASQSAFNKDKSSVNRLRYAWISGLLGPTAGDDARLQGLLEPLLAKTGGFAPSHPLRPVAEVMLAQLSERARQLKEEQKKADALQQKLDALKAIEKNLLDRERRRN
jgi:hypothetical protein